MSIVGYILGLGDRHLSNIMIQRFSGKVVHIDFGDCFEVTMTRDRFPEKVPFRLTRVLVIAMEACGIDGNYKFGCENVMRVLRQNKESLLAVLEAFLSDPILNWRLLTDDAIQVDGGADDGFLKIDQGVKASLKTITISKNMKDDAPKPAAHEENFPSVGRKEKELKQKLAEDENKGKKIVNKNTEKAIARIRSKLNGRDFKDEIPLNEENQVGKLIRQATSPENICQSFLGWNPFV